MDEALGRFEHVARRARFFSDAEVRARPDVHPLDQRDIHEQLRPLVGGLFDNGHYAQATFEAFKYVDKVVQHLGASKEAGAKLMMSTLGGKSPAVGLTPCGDASEKDEQEGYKFIFAGSMLAIRNPRGHEFGMVDTPDVCLDHLSLASMLLRRLEQAGHSVQIP